MPIGSIVEAAPNISNEAPIPMMRSPNPQIRKMRLRCKIPTTHKVVEIANNAGVQSVIHPGGSIKDQLSIDFCDSVNMKMVISGTRHFKH